jgi:hypothetical protein
MTRPAQWRRRFGDVGYEIRYRLSRVLFAFFGPPHLGAGSDPAEQLKRERAERLARRRAADD